MLHRVTWSAFALALAAGATVGVGCKNQQARDVTKAETELTGAQQDLRNKMSDLQARQQQELSEAQQRGATAVELAELSSKHEREQAELRAQGGKSVEEARQQAATERATMAHEREGARLDTQKRLTKLEARANEYRAKASTLDPVKRSEFDRAWSQYLSERRDVDGAMNVMGTVPDDQFGTWRDRLGVQLDELESATNKLGESF